MSARDGRLSVRGMNSTAIPQASTDISGPTPADAVWPLRSADSPNTGRAHLYLAPGRDRPRHPILVCEGFPGSHTQEYLLAVLEQHGLMARLRGQGYDIVLIGLDQGTDRIQNNAGVVEDAIAQVQAQTSEPLVVAGMSMGALVVRYALARIERAGRDHRTRAYLSWDAPQRGAYTSLAAQWFAQTFRRAHSQIEQLAQLLDSPANQQLMTHWLHAGEVIESPLRRAWNEELASLGDYPQQLQRWALASGRGDGVRSEPAHQLALDCPGDASFAVRLWTLGEQHQRVRIGEGRCGGEVCAALEHASAWSWESVPGGLGRYLELAAQCVEALGYGDVQLRSVTSCAVPTVSALDLDLDPDAPIPEPGRAASPFHDYHHQGKDNHRHLYFAAATADWLAQRLGRPRA